MKDKAINNLVTAVFLVVTIIFITEASRHRSDYFWGIVVSLLPAYLTVASIKDKDK